MKRLKEAEQIGREADGLLGRISVHLMDWFWSEESRQRVSILDAWQIVEAKRKCIMDEATLKRSTERFDRIVEMPTCSLSIHTTPC